MTSAPPASSIGQPVISGVRWGAFNQVVQQVTRLGVQLVLTRLLAPESFGLLTLAFVVINFGSLLTGLGFTQALIQRRNLSKDLVDAAFAGSAMLGATIAMATVLVAEPLAALLGDPAVAPVLRACGVIFLFQGIEGVPNGMLRRHLRFREFVVSSTVAVVVGGGVGVVMAFAGHGVWALVGFAVVEAVVATGLAWVLAIHARVWRPNWTFDLRPLRSILGYSGAVTGNRLLFYGSRNVDNLIVGRVLGATALGFYGLAYRVMLLPIQRISEVVGGVALPAFAHLQDERERLAAVYLRAVRSLAAVIVPTTVGIAITAPDLVPVVFGVQWEPAVLPLRLLALSGPALALVRLNGSLWEATNRAGLNLALGALTLGILVPGFLIGVRHGVTGVAIAYTLAAYLGQIPSTVLVARTAGIPVGRQLTNLRSVSFAVAVMIAAAVAVASVVDGGGHGLRLLATATAGSLAYGAVLWLVDQDLVRDAMSVFSRPEVTDTARTES